MNFLRSPKNKLVAAAVAVLALALLAPTQGISASIAARALLGVACVAGIGWWFLRQRSGASEPIAPAPRLRVLARTGLSQKTGLALVEADGQSYLVAFGDGFAELQVADATTAFPVPKARRPRPLNRRSKQSRKAVAS